MSLKAEILRSEPGKGKVALFYLGQETLLVKHNNRYMLFDPYLSDYVDRNFATEAVPWKRRYPAPIEPGELDFIDCVFCSHAHGDHADPVTLRAVADASPNARFFGSKDVVDVYLGCGIAEDRTVRLKADEPYALFDQSGVTAVPAAHEELHPTEDGSFAELGFILNLDGIRLYHAGDCCMYDGLVGRIRDVDIACLPINGRDYFRTSNDIIGNFDSAEALLLAAQAGAKLLIPLHFDLYDVNCVNPALFVDLQQRLAPQQRYHIFMPGEKFIYEQ